MPGKNLALELNAKELSANQIARFLNSNISKLLEVQSWLFLHAGTYLLKLQIDDLILGGRVQVYPGMPKEAIKT